VRFYLFERFVLGLRELHAHLETGHVGCYFEHSSWLYGAFALWTRSVNFLKQIEDDTKPVDDIMSFETAANCAFAMATTRDRNHRPWCGKAWVGDRNNRNDKNDRYISFKDLVKPIIDGIGKLMKPQMDSQSANMAASQNWR
jgi:hypothetical protein